MNLSDPPMYDTIDKCGKGIFIFERHHRVHTVSWIPNLCRRICSSKIGKNNKIPYRCSTKITRKRAIRVPLGKKCKGGQGEKCLSTLSGYSLMDSPSLGHL